MIGILDLPAEVLKEILCFCDPRSITETCRDFLSIAHSIPSLWSSIRLGPAQFFVPNGPIILQAQLQRVKNSSLNVSVGPVMPEAVQSLVLLDLFAVLSEFKAQINRLEITADAAFIAANLLNIIFPGLKSSGTFPNLRELSIRLPSDGQDPYRAGWPQLDQVLECYPRAFSGLQALSIPSVCIPLHPDAASFSHLHTLIIDGSRKQPVANEIIRVLQSNPLIETLWVKHYSWMSQFASIASTAHVVLPRLTRLSLSAHGPGSDLLYVIEAPALHDLHLDASCGQSYLHHRRAMVAWTNGQSNDVQAALRSFVSRASGLRRLALTNIHFSQTYWEWLLFGQATAPPLPELESIALRDMGRAKVPWGFNDSLLLQYSREPGPKCLRRLTLLRCSFSLSGASVVHMV